MQYIQNVSRLITLLKQLVLTLTVSLLMSNLIWLYVYRQECQINGQRIYVTADGGTLMALAAEKAPPSRYEARNLVRAFMELMFEHDAHSFRERVNHGLKLIDHNDGQALYETFRRGKILENYHRYNSHTRWTLDSIRVDMGAEPYRGQVWGSQRVVYDNQEKVQPVAASFTLSRQNRSDLNPYGLLIDEFNFMEYQPAPNP